MGQDGKDTSIYDPSNPQLHANFAQDAFGYSLNYFKGDYKAISQVRWNNATNRFEAVTTGSDLMASRHDLHNGNISSMVTTIVKPTITPGDTMQFVPLPQGTAYKYDQLNRLVEMKAWQNLNSTNNTWGTGLTYNGMYNNKFSYDANGNILTVLAKNQSGQTIDDQTYHQQTLAGKKVRNRTYSITDLATLTSGNDLLNQIPFDNNDATINTNNNYSFTEIGERKSDKQDSIDLIIWTTYGKIKEVKRTPGCAKMNVKFRYDPQGNTLSKHLFKSDDTTWISSEYYIRDAQGNLMNVYEKQIISNSISYSKTESHIYGSGLIGIDRTEKQMIGSSFLLNQPVSIHLLGSKNYTGDNHLGNVLVSFTDKKLQVDHNSDNIVDYYLPMVSSSNDYAPYGSLLTERTFNKGGYPNSFNGKRDLEGLNFQDYGMRIYNPMERIFPSIDPISGKFPMLAPYQYASNSPILNIDYDGLEGIPNLSTYLFGQAGITSTTAKQIEIETVKTIEKAARLSQDALVVTGGVLAIVGSGGAAAPIVFGAVAAGGGSAKFYFDAKGDYETADQIPTTVSGAVMVTANYVSGDKVFSEKFIATAEFVEGVLTLDLKNLKNPDIKKATVEGIGVVTLTIDATSIPENLKGLLTSDQSAVKPSQDNYYQKDNLQIPAPANLPTPAQIKEAEKKKESKNASTKKDDSKKTTTTDKKTSSTKKG